MQFEEIHCNLSPPLETHRNLSFPQETHRNLPLPEESHRNLSLPKEAISLNYVSITPSFQAAYGNTQWQPQVCEILNGKALYINKSHVPLIAKKYSHFRPNPVAVCELSTITNNEGSSHS